MIIIKSLIVGLISSYLIFVFGWAFVTLSWPPFKFLLWDDIARAMLIVSFAGVSGVSFLTVTLS